MSTASESVVHDVAAGMARSLRAAGVDVAVGQAVLFARAVAAVGPADADLVRHAGRATLVTRPEDIPVFERVFAEVFHGMASTDGEVHELEPVTLLVDDDLGSDATDGSGAGDEATLTVRWSPTETLRRKDFAAYTVDEMHEARRLMAEVRLAGALRRSRRRRRTSRPRGRPDLRRTMRQSVRTGGETVRREFTEPDDRPRRVVLVLDVSGSMEAYARALLRFVHAAVSGRGGVEAFALGTRLTRITRALASRDPDDAVRRAAEQVADWSGGTRLGDGLRWFNDRWGVRGMARGAVVVIMSDGWDRGDPEVMTEQMRRLARVAHRIVWVNPLKATDGYEPIARGMAAALPFVDDFVEGHSLAALDEVTAAIGRVDQARRPL